MNDHLVLCADRLITIETLQSLKAAETDKPYGEGSSSSSPQAADYPSTCAIKVADDNHDISGEEEDPLIQIVECRICQEEDNVKNLETPCACAGSLKVYDQNDNMYMPLQKPYVLVSLMLTSFMFLLN